MHETTTERHMKNKNKPDEENNNTNANNNKTKNETANNKTKNTKHDSTSKAINNNTKTNKDSQQLEDKVSKHNIKKPTHETPNRDQQQTLKPEKAGTILANQRIDRLKKRTNSKQMNDDDAKDEEHKMEEDDPHTMNYTEDNIDDATIPPNQKIGKLQQIDNSQHTPEDNANNQGQAIDHPTSNPRPTTPTQPYQLIYIDDTVTMLPLTLLNQNFIGPLTEWMTQYEKLQASTKQIRLPNQISHDFQELVIDQCLEQKTLRLPDEAYNMVFEFLEMTPPPREHENTEIAKDIRSKLATSKDKQKMLWEIQRQWCQAALRKILFANINSYDRRELMPSLFEEDTTSDEEDSQITMTSPILIFTPKTKDKEETLQRIRIGIVT